MASLARFSFAAPTAPPLGPFTPLLSPSAARFTGLDSARPRPVLLTAIGGVLQRVFSSITATSTLHLKRLSLGNFSRQRPNLCLCPTPTSGYHRNPTMTSVPTGNSSLAITVILPLLILFSVLFGAAMALKRRRESPTSLHHHKKAQHKNAPHDSPYSESPTLFHQGETILPLGSNTSRLSYFWIGALTFGLRGLALLFRLICMEKLLDMVENNATEQRAATSTDSAIAELRTLNRRLGQAANIVKPTQTVASPARLADDNTTLVSPFLVDAKSKPEQAFVPPSQYDEVELILPEDVEVHLPTCVKIDPASTCKASVTPPVQNLLVGVADPLAVTPAGTASVAWLGGGGDSLPTSYRRSSSSIRRLTSSPDTVDAPFPVEPPGVPVTPLAASSPVYKSPYTPFGPIRLTTDDHPSTPPHNDAAVSPAVEPSGVPDRSVAAPEPQAESSAQAVARRTRRSEDSLQRLRSVEAPDVAHPPSVYQIAVQRIFQPFFDDLANSSRPTALVSPVRPLDPTLKGHTGGPAKCTTRADITSIHRSPEIFRIRSVTGTPPRINSPSAEEPSEMDALKATILLSERSSAATETTRSQSETAAAIRELVREVMGRSREASGAFDLQMRAKYPGQFSAEHHLGSLDEIRENPQQVIQRLQEVGPKLGEQVQRTKLEFTETDQQAIGEETAREKRDAVEYNHDDPIVYHKVYSSDHHDEKCELRESSAACTSRSSTHPPKSRPLTVLESNRIARLHSLLELDLPVCDPPPFKEPRGSRDASQASPAESSWWTDDHLVDETTYDEDSLEDDDGVDESSQEQTPSHSSSHALIQDEQPQKIRDLFYSPTSAPSTLPLRNTNFLKGDRLTGFGAGTPCGRQIQRLDPRDAFTTSTPRVNYAHFSGFSTSTPRRDVDHRKDTWVDFF